MEELFPVPEFKQVSKIELSATRGIEASLGHSEVASVSGSFHYTLEENTLFSLYCLLFDHFLVFGVGFFQTDSTIISIFFICFNPILPKPLDTIV